LTDKWKQGQNTKELSLKDDDTFGRPPDDATNLVSPLSCHESGVMMQRKSQHHQNGYDASTVWQTMKPKHLQKNLTRHEKAQGEPSDTPFMWKSSQKVIFPSWDLGPQGLLKLQISDFRWLLWNFRCIFWISDDSSEISDVYSESQNVWNVGITISQFGICQLYNVCCLSAKHCMLYTTKQLYAVLICF
jgi:hypothetical protein